MTKNFKLVLALVLAMMMLATMIPAFAVGETYSLKIEKAEADHTYTAYQIFAGTRASNSNDDNKLGDVVWGANVSDEGKTALLNFRAPGDNTTAVPHASALALSEYLGNHTDAATAIEFAKVAAVAANLTGNGTTGNLSGTNYTISGLQGGYYVVVDSYDNASSETEGIDYSISRYMVQVVGNATVVNKADKPTVEKKIIENSTPVDSNNKSIGDTVSYRITSNVPNMGDYTTYKMTFTDKLSEGLTFVKDKDGDDDNQGVTLTIGGKVVAPSAYTVAFPTADDGDTNSYMTLAITDLKTLTTKDGTAVNFGDAIVLTYDATINEKAVIGNTGNPNEVKLTYSNNPNKSGNGTPESPNETTDTPWDKVITYLFEIDITKYAESTSGSKLAGARFKLEGRNLVNKVRIDGEHFVQDTTGEYYLVDGIYTTKAPANATAETPKYKKVPYTYTEAQTADNFTVEGVTDAQGSLKFTGLKAGTYTITELQAPDGYNLLTKPIIVEIEAETPTTVSAITDKCKWGYTYKVQGETDPSKITTVEKADTVSKADVSIINNAGATLPETGGIGTTIFYVAGSIMVLAAAILLITKRRMGAND